jgi:phosphoglycerate dehydrogenase-like enzyme
MTDAKDTATVVLVTIPFEARWQEQLRQLSPNLRVEHHVVRSVHDIPATLWREVQILYTSSKILPEGEQAPKLRLVQLYSAGVDSAATSPLFQTSAVFSTTSGVHAVNAAEYTFMMILAWCHKFPTMLEWKQRSMWPHSEERHALFMPEPLQGKTIGIVGYGSIGRQVAKVAKAFGMRVLAMQHGSDHRDHGFLFPDEGDPDGTLPSRYYSSDQLHTLLNESDFVVVSLPLTPRTRGMFDDAAFQAMKPSALFVNIARGGVCDDDALVRALEKKGIAGAALDVFGKEPLPPGHPLWHLPNIFMTPHIMGTTPHYDERSAMIFIENVRRYLEGQPLFNVVDKAQGY